MSTLSEAQSKRLLAARGIPVVLEEVASSVSEAVGAAGRIGYPVVAKLCGPAIAHKTERGLVRLGLENDAEVAEAATSLLTASRPEDGDVGVLISAMVVGSRELIAGAVRDRQFGPCVMLGLGGVLAEAIGDVAFRMAPLSAVDAEDIVDDLASQALLGPVRGEPALDRARLVEVLLALSRLVIHDPTIRAVECNPLVITNGVPVAVDALVEVEG